MWVDAFYFLAFQKQRSRELLLICVPQCSEELYMQMVTDSQKLRAQLSRKTLHTKAMDKTFTLRMQTRSQKLKTVSFLHITTPSTQLVMNSFPRIIVSWDKMVTPPLGLFHTDQKVEACIQKRQLEYQFQTIQSSRALKADLVEDCILNRTVLQ